MLANSAHIVIKCGEAGVRGLQFASLLKKSIVSGAPPYIDAL